LTHGASTEEISKLIAKREKFMENFQSPKDFVLHTQEFAQGYGENQLRDRVIEKERK